MAMYRDILRNYILICKPIWARKIPFGRNVAFQIMSDEEQICFKKAVGWIHDSVLSLREVGLKFLPAEIKRPRPEDKIQELVIPFDYVNAEWLPKAVQDTADIRKTQTNRHL